MGKRSIKDKDGTTKVLFQKSYHTIYTQSRTCSGVSQLCTKSGLVNIQKNLSETKQYYLDGDKVKRDLSIETDICIIRRYCKKIKNKMSVPEGSRSKYSTVVDTEINTIDEFEADACGDSEQTEQTNVNQITDINDVVMENLKDLLNNWIKKYLIETKENKDKLETVLNNIIQNGEVAKIDKSCNSSSRSTYILNRSNMSQVKNKKIGTASECERCKAKKTKKRDTENSIHSTPVSSRKLKVISTLSIPRNLHKKDKRDRSRSKPTSKRMMHKKLVLSINKSDQLDILSSFDFLSVSAETFTKRCANIKIKRDKNNKKKRHIVFFPKPFYKSPTDSDVSNKNYAADLSPKSNLLEWPSLVQSIYAGDPANVDSVDDSYSKTDNFTMTDNNLNEHTHVHSATDKKYLETRYLKEPSSITQKPPLNELEVSEPLITIDFIDEITDASSNQRRKGVSSKTIVNKTEIDQKPAVTHDNKIKPWKSKSKRKKLKAYNRLSKYHSFHSKQFTFLYKKTNITPFSEEKQFLEHFQNVFKYFNDYNKDNDLKLSINVNIIPLRDVRNKDETTMTIKQEGSSSTSDAVFYSEPTIKLHTEEYKEAQFEKESDVIIPILDGTLSQSKYLLKNESQNSTQPSSVKYDTKFTSDCGTITEIEFTNDIREIKNVIKDLAKAAEDIVKKHVKHEAKVYHYVNNMTCTVENNTSKGIQMSNEFTKQPLMSGIKLSICPKKDTGELYKRMMQKSVSYNIIESELILKVTDMTSNANNKKDSSNLRENQVTKSKSLIEIANETKQLMTFYCSRPRTDATCFTDVCKTRREYVEPDCVSSECSEDCNAPPPICSVVSTCEADDDEEEKSLVCTLPKTCRRRGMGFGEGFLYCIMMWIPFIVVFCLFYQHVIHQHIIHSQGRITSTTSTTPVVSPAAVIPKVRAVEKAADIDSSDSLPTTIKNSIFYVRLSDLGF